MRNKSTYYFLSLVSAIILLGLTEMVFCTPDSKSSQKDLASSKSLIDRIMQISDSLPQKPGLEASDKEWELWWAKGYELRKARIEVIVELEKEGLSDEQLKPYLEMKIEDIRRCFRHARLEANKFESKFWTMMDEGSPLARTLATELHWELNVYYVNTHLMSLSDADMRKIADFELSREDQPEAGRLMAKAIDTGFIGDDAKVKWRTWTLENMPEKSEGYQLVFGRQQLISDVGKVFKFRSEDLNGSIIDFEKLQGKVVLVDFWAFWCGICLSEIPALKELNEAYYDKGLRIIGVFNDYRIDQLRGYIKEKDIGWPQLVNRKSTKSSFIHPLAEKYGIKALPRYLVIGRDGKFKKGGIRVESLKPEILELLDVAVD